MSPFEFENEEIYEHVTVLRPWRAHDLIWKKIMFLVLHMKEEVKKALLIYLIIKHLPRSVELAYPIQRNELARFKRCLKEFWPEKDN